MLQVFPCRMVPELTETEGGRPRKELVKLQPQLTRHVVGFCSGLVSAILSSNWE